MTTEDTQEFRREMLAEIRRAAETTREAAHADAITLAGSAAKARDVRDLFYIIAGALFAVFGAGMVWQEVQARPTVGEVQTIVDNAVDRSETNLERLIKVQCR